MRSGKIPFQFDLRSLYERAARQLKGRVGDVSINLGIVSFSASPKSKEKKAGRQVVIRLRDRRVLSASECCDDCIERALASLQEIRGIVVDQQVALADFQDGPLFLLLDAVRLGIQQFLTYEELLKRPPDAPTHSRFGAFQRPADVRQSYFDALEVLRGHVSRCLSQIAVLAGMPAPKEGLIPNYRGPWQADAYLPPPS